MSWPAPASPGGESGVSTPILIGFCADAWPANTTLLLDAYDEDVVNNESRVLLRLHPNVAPVQVAVFPLSKKQELIDVAQMVIGSLRGQFRVEYDQTGGSIGKRYRRQDEIGTPFCVTVDFDTLTDQAVTIRRRDSTEQERVAIATLPDRLTELTH